LAPARSFTTVVGTMLGEHPQMYGVLETNLFRFATMRERGNVLKRRSRHSGLLRAVAQLWTGRQTIETVELAKRWIAQRLDRPCTSVMRELANKVGERILVEKTPMTAQRVEYMQRARRAFPDARFIHLLRHPRSQCESMMEFMGARQRRGTFQGNADSGALHELGVLDWSSEPPTLDPQRYWLSQQVSIETFLDGLPKEQWLRIRGEDLLGEPDRHLSMIAEWLGLRTDREAIEAMKHPENSPFAGFGPPNAPAGGDGKFLQDPRLRPYRPKPLSLAGPVPWRPDGMGFSAEVCELASEFGYT
jgi:hypothetical protein